MLKPFVGCHLSPRTGHTIRDGNWTRGCGHPRVLDPMGAGVDPDFHPRVHPHPPETNKAQPKWSKPSPICVIYISEILVYLSLSVSPLPHPAAARRLGAHHPHSPSQFPPLTSLPRLPALPLWRGMASAHRLPLRRRISPPQARPAAAGGLHLRRAAAGSLPRRPDLSTSAKTATSTKACAVREYRHIRSFMSQPDSQGTMAAKAPGPPRTSPPSSSFHPFPLGVLLLLGLVLVGGVELRRQSPSSLASLCFVLGPPPPQSMVERSGHRGKLPAGSPQSPHQHSRPRTRRGGGGGAC